MDISAKGSKFLSFFIPLYGLLLHFKMNPSVSSYLSTISPISFNFSCTHPSLDNSEEKFLLSLSRLMVLHIDATASFPLHRNLNLLRLFGTEHRFLDIQSAYHRRPGTLLLEPVGVLRCPLELKLYLFSVHVFSPLQVKIEM